MFIFPTFALVEQRFSDWWSGGSGGCWGGAGATKLYTSPGHSVFSLLLLFLAVWLKALGSFHISFSTFLMSFYFTFVLKVQTSIQNNGPAEPRFWQQENKDIEWCVAHAALNTHTDNIKCWTIKRRSFMWVSGCYIFNLVLFYFIHFILFIFSVPTKKGNFFAL